MNRPRKLEYASRHKSVVAPDVKLSQMKALADTVGSFLSPHCILMDIVDDVSHNDHCLLCHVVQRHDSICQSFIRSFLFVIQIFLLGF